MVEKQINLSVLDVLPSGLFRFLLPVLEPPVGETRCSDGWLRGTSIPQPVTDDGVKSELA